MAKFGGYPEKFRQEGVRVHGPDIVKVGDEVESIRFVMGIIPKGTRLKIADILITPNGNTRGFIKRLIFDEYEGEFNPNRFIKVTSSE